MENCAPVSPDTVPMVVEYCIAEVKLVPVILRELKEAVLEVRLRKLAVVPDILTALSDWIPEMLFILRVPTDKFENIPELA